jgi:uncharacterized protein (DUF4415 family)
MSTKSNRRSILVPSPQEDKAITAAAKSDPDAQPLTARQLDAMVPLQVLRGRPRSGAAKQLVSVRYSPEVVAYFKSTGAGWQARMDGVLRRYVSRQAQRSVASD